MAYEVARNPQSHVNFMILSSSLPRTLDIPCSTTSFAELFHQYVSYSVAL